jgi:hypothetical protein
VSVMPTPTCTGKSIKINPGDTCDSVAETNNISTWLLLARNGLIEGCADFPESGSLCVENSCRTHKIVPGEDCSSVAKANNISAIQFISWNRQIDPACQNFNQSIGHIVCVSNPLGYVAPGNPSPQRPSITTDAPIPGRTGPGSLVHCGQWYNVTVGEDCGKS